MKNVVFKTSPDNVVDIVNSHYTEDMLYWEGVLIDNYALLDANIIYDDKVYKDVILEEVYKNEWTSWYNVTLTNDRNLAYECAEEYA